MVRRRLFKESSYWPRLRFDEVFDDLNENRARYGLVAIENSIAGSLVFNYDLLSNHELNIVGEAYLRIRHCLMALPGNSLDQIKEVWSHPMAIYQSQRFLNLHALRILEKEDTAGSARMIKELGMQKIAAIASAEAADLYGLEILAENIETDPNNYTRFLILGKKELPLLRKAEGKRCSLYVRFQDKAGDLHHFLEPLHRFKLSMTKIESRPRIGSPWHYDFYIDIDFTKVSKSIQEELLEELKDRCKYLRLLGIYPTFGYI